jgi:phospho-N-acetylmuramoyl-pentapeptide-transferase
LLYWLLYQRLYPYFHPFRIFRYLTFRTVFASLTALLIAMFIGPYVIQKLREFQIGQYIREDGPQSHQKKSGTPTMGGVLIVIAILLPTVLWSDPANPFVWIAVCSTLAYGAIGFADDYTKVVNRRNLGLTARAKLLRSSSCSQRSSAFRSLSSGAQTCFGTTGPAPCLTLVCWPLCLSSASSSSC